MNGVDSGVASDPVRVVLAPDVAGGLWLDASCAGVFAAWRNERLKPVVNRDLLVRYARVWRALGLPTEQIRRWSMWFSATSRAYFQGTDLVTSLDAVGCCSRLALHGGAKWVLHRGTVVAPEGGVPWLTAERFCASAI
jgi:hypothetical protein